MWVSALSMHAQKFALVDMDYIFKNIPAYERANEQLNQVSKKWQAEVEAIQIEAQTMYKNYQNEVVFLSQEQKKTKQDAIVAKEKEAADLKKKYFGPEGELFKKRSALMTPIQEEVYNAVKDIADLRGYQLILVVVLKKIPDISLHGFGHISLSSVISADKVADPYFIRIFVICASDVSYYFSGRLEQYGTGNIIGSGIILFGQFKRLIYPVSRPVGKCLVKAYFRKTAVRSHFDIYFLIPALN